VLQVWSQFERNLLPVWATVVHIRCISQLFTVAAYRCFCPGDCDDGLVEGQRHHCRENHVEGMRLRHSTAHTSLHFGARCERVPKRALLDVLNSDHAVCDSSGCRNRQCKGKNARVITDTDTIPNHTKPNQTKPNQTKPNQTKGSHRSRDVQANIVPPSGEQCGDPDNIRS
jgi:hypothetical protein